MTPIMYFYVLGDSDAQISDASALGLAIIFCVICVVAIVVFIMDIFNK